MLENQQPDELHENLHRLGTRYAGVYLVNKFFIRIFTRKKKKDIPSYDYEKNTFSDQDQMMLQQENYPTLFHEYIHYIHEVSTLAGITQFYLNIINRSIFSEFVQLPTTSLALPVSGTRRELLDKIKKTLGAVTGGGAYELGDRMIFRIHQVELLDFLAYEPSRDINASIKVPMVTYGYLDETTQREVQDSVIFGKYFLYEGLAHHLDQIVTVQLKRSVTPRRFVSPEYKIMEMVARFLCPKIDERTMLEMASMSLSYFNCGHRFIGMLQEAATVPYLPGYVMEMRNEVFNHLKEHEEEITFTLSEIKRVFEKRTGMHTAATHLCDVMAAAYQQRMKQPTFEIDVTYSGYLREMRRYVDLCDLVYELADEDTYLRDYAGSYLTNDLANDLRTFLCHVDYYQTSVGGIKEHCCPLYTLCPHRIRQEKAEQCSTMPRLSYEDHEKYGWCHYALGVAYMTGQDIP